MVDFSPGEGQQQLAHGVSRGIVDPRKPKAPVGAAAISAQFSVCCRSTYNATKPPAAPRNSFKIIAKRIRMQGFIVRDHMVDRDEFIREVSSLIRNDQLLWEETITEELQNAPEAFIGLFDGDNRGKSLVRIESHKTL